LIDTVVDWSNDHVTLLCLSLFELVRFAEVPDRLMVITMTIWRKITQQWEL